MRSGWLVWKKSDRNIMDGKIVLNRDFREFIQSLNDNKVHYLVIGGYAVALHGHPRYTKDIDIWLGLTAENAVRTVKALEQFGFGSLGLQTEDFLVPDQIIQLGYPPNRIDLLTSLGDMDFHECYDSRLEIMISGIKINFIDLPNLRKSKKIAGRYQDLADLENLR
jgi:predicted nucleotidyltransferase